MDPQQELFTELLLRLKELGYDVYDDGIPPKSTPYPFIYLADNQQDDKENKTAIFGEVAQTIHVWHNNTKQRGTVSKMLLDVKTVCRKVRETDNFKWFVGNINQKIITDKTTKQPLLHGWLYITFEFS